MPDTSLNLKKECSITTCNNPVLTDKKQLVNVQQESVHRFCDTTTMNRSTATKMNSRTITPITTTDTEPKIYRYSVSTLIEISKSPISKRRPDYLDNPIFATKGFVKTNDMQYDDRLSINRNQNQSDNTNKRRQVLGGMNLNSSNLNESRDRIRKEHDNTLILSPQRRSFNMGCHMPSNNNSGGGGGGSGSGSGGGASASMNRMDRNDTNIRGRIGSGRIVNRDVSWDYKVEKDNQDEFIFRPGGGLMGLRDRERDNNTKEQRNDYYRDDHKYDRRSYNNNNSNNNMRDDGKDTMNTNSRINNHRNNRYTNQNINNHYNNHRNNRYMDNREDEPEWFSGGPTSQNDTIELRGFDDVKDEINHSHNKFIDNNNVTNNSSDGMVDPLENIKSPNSSVPQPSQPPNSNYNNMGGNETKTKSNIIDQNFNISSTNDKQKTNPDFNFEDFLTIPGLLPNNDLSSRDNRSSRFRQWFHSDSPNNRVPESPHSSHHGDLSNMVEDFLTEQFHGGKMNDTFGGGGGGGGKLGGGQLINSTIGLSNNESNKYFAPISPENPTNNLLEILQRNENVGHSNPSDCSIIQQSTNKIQSVEELEARMLQSGGGGPMHKQQINVNNQTSSSVQQNEMNAFKKLLSQITKNTHNMGMPMQQQNSEPHSLISGSSDGIFNTDTLLPNNDNSEGTCLLQLLNKQKDIKRMNHTPLLFNNFSNMTINQQQHNMPPRSNPQQQQIQMQKFQMSQLNQIVNQNNSDMFSKMLHLDQMPINNNQRNEPPINVDGMHWNENQYQAIMNSNNNRNRDFIMNNNQIDGSNLPNHPNNALTSAIMQLNQVGKMAQHQNDIGGGQQSNPLIYSPASHIQSQKSVRSSPLPNAGAASQRIPSPRELQFHTQSIMQQALIRKKLEEQREKFRRQEIQEQQTTNVIPSQPPLPPSQQQSVTLPNKHNIHIQSPTQIAFTPTSVLRKMTADKDDNNISSLSTIMGTDANAQNGSLINGSVVGNSNNKIRENTAAVVDKAMNSANNLNFLKHMQQAQSSQQNTHGLLQGSLNQNHGITQQQSNPLYNNPQMQMKWNTQMQHQQQSIKPVGRPILKGGTQMQYAASLESYQQQQSLIQQSQQQQQQQQSSQRTQRKKSNSNMILGMGGGNGSSGGGSGGGLIGTTPHQTKAIPNQINQQQTANTSAQLHQILHHRQMQQQQRALRGPQFNYNQSAPGNGTGAECLINYNREGCLSPTSNQLARWFSPELLAQAQAGKLPSLNIGQALSLEEFEKRIQHSSSKVHN